MIENDNVDLINDILNSITPEEFVPLNLIQSNREKAVNLIYEKFMNYDKNIKNRLETQDILQNYEYIETIDKLKPNDRFRYISTRYFYDLKVSSIVSLINNEHNKLYIRNGIFLKSIKNNVHIFKLLPEETIVKMKLVEIIQQDED